MLTSEEWAVVWLSCRVATVAVLLVLPLAILVAYGLARRKVPFPLLFENLILLPLVVPPVVVGYALLVFFGSSGPVGSVLAKVGVTIPFTWFGAALAAGVVSFPLMAQTIRTAFEQIDPEWEEAGYVYGGTRLTVFRHITAPLAARGIAAGVVLAFARAVGEFGATIMVAGNIPGQTRTIPLAIYTAFNQVAGDAAVARLCIAAVGLSLASLIGHALLARRLYSPVDRTR